MSRSTGRATLRLAVMAALILAGCSKGGTITPDEKPLIGKWQALAAATNSLQHTVELTLASDHTYIERHIARGGPSEGMSTGRGTWSATGTEIHFNGTEVAGGLQPPAASGDHSYGYTLNGTTLIVERIADGAGASMTQVAQ